MSASIHHRILDAAHQLFGKRGFSRVRVDDLADYLGISKKTIYNHFPEGKRSLWEETKNRFVTEQIDRLRRVMRVEGKDFATRGLEAIAVGHESFQAFLGIRGDDPVTSEDRRVFLPGLRSLLCDALADFLVEGIDAGILRGDLPVRSTSLVIIALIESWSDPESGLAGGEVPDVATFIEGILFEGVLSEEGRRLNRERTETGNGASGEGGR